MHHSTALVGEPVAWPEDIAATLAKRVDDDLALQIAALHRAGFSLVALGAGEDGKSPRGPISGDRWTLQQVLGRMDGGTMYGIRPDGLVVVDVDTDTDEARQYVADRFGESSVQVRTSRGVHHYFRLGDCPPPANIRLPGVVIDFPKSYVVGPGSIRPDSGVVYDPIVGALATTDLPEFQDHQPLPATLRGKSVQVGQRNDTLFRWGLQLARDAESFDDLFGQLMAQRNLEFDYPEDFPAEEVERIAKSVWGYRSKGSLWAGRDSTYRVNNRMLIDQLVTKGHTDAFALYHLLAANHGHLGRAFYINPDSMMKAGLWGKGRDTLYKARDVLLNEGLLQKAKGYTFTLSPLGLAA